MTNKSLQSLIERVSALPADLQERFAKQWLADLEDEQQWDEKFSRSQGVLERLAKQALENYNAGKTVPKGWDEV